VILIVVYSSAVDCLKRLSLQNDQLLVDWEIKPVHSQVSSSTSCSNSSGWI